MSVGGHFQTVKRFTDEDRSLPERVAGGRGAAKIIVQSLELPTSSEQQERVFTIAMDNLLFRSLVIKLNHPPRVTQPVMPAETLGARRIQA